MTDDAVKVSVAGGEEVEQTLRLARDNIERDIAKYRAWTFGAVMLTTAFQHFAVGHDSSFGATYYFTGCFSYALALAWIVRRVGGHPLFAYASICCDVLASALAFVVIPMLVPESEVERSRAYAHYVLGPSLVFVLLISSLRNDRRSAAFGGVIAIAVFLAVAIHLFGVTPMLIPVSLILGLAGVIGTASAREARANLDRFARLHLLRRYLSPAAVDRVMREDPDASTALGGRLVHATILAADLRGFTAMSETLTPDEVLRQLNAYHGVMIDVVDAHHGSIDKFIGDGTLVVFGLDDAKERAAEDAIACARSMLSALDTLNIERSKSDLDPLRMGIGIHSGSVVAGNLGAHGKRMEFTVIGDAVNTAARLEGMTKEAKTSVLVSGDTVELLTDKNGLRELAPVSLRGKVKTLSVYALE